MIVLSACNTAEETIDAANPSEGKTENSEVTTTEPSTETNSENAQESENATENQTSEVAFSPSTLSYNIANVSYKDETINTESEQLEYSVALTDKFYLTQEEPGLDSIIYKDNEALSMRVEVFSKDDWKFKDVIKNSEDYLAASSNDGHYNDFKTPTIYENNTYEQVKSYIVEYESDKLILVLLELDKKIIRLTIFDDYITNVSDALLQIGATIK